MPPMRLTAAGFGVHALLFAVAALCCGVATTVAVQAWLGIYDPCSAPPPDMSGGVPWITWLLVEAGLCTVHTVVHLITMVTSRRVLVGDSPLSLSIVYAVILMVDTG